MSGETKFIIITVLLTIGVIVGGVFYFTQSGGGQSDERVDMVKLLSRDMPSKGNPHAPIHIVEFSDFQCPACAAQKPILDQVLAEYKDAVYFEYHFFPLAMHKWSHITAEAAAVAHSQNKFFEYADLLFKKQHEWTSSDTVVPLLLEYAQTVGLDVARFNTDLLQKKYSNLVDTSYARGVSFQVRSTPTFFMNGKKIDGGLPYTEWKKLLDEELKKKS